MLTVICVLCLLLGIGMLIWIRFSEKDDCGDLTDVDIIRSVVSFFSFIATIGIFITIMCFIPKFANESVYDTRIEIVQESNQQLEEQICSAVEKYLEHEENVYEKLDITTAIGLFSAYPNLKSNELVQALIDTYKANAEEIKALKLEKANLAIYKFLVYFGK